MQKNKNVLLPKFSNCLLKILKPCVYLHFPTISPLVFIKTYKNHKVTVGA